MICCPACELGPSECTCDAPAPAPPRGAKVVGHIRSGRVTWADAPSRDLGTRRTVTDSPHTSSRSLRARGQTDRSARRRPPWAAARWPIVAAVALATTFVAWAFIPDRSVDWDTLEPTGGSEVEVLRNGKRLQRWWMVTGEEEISAEIVGPETVRVESRLLTHRERYTDLPYVVEVRLDDGEGELLRQSATLSTATTLEGWQVSKKERVEFQVPLGRHRLTAVLVGSDDDHCLMRLRHVDHTE